MSTARKGAVAIPSEATNSFSTSLSWLAASAAASGRTGRTSASTSAVRAGTFSNS